ncbi:MAG: membrane protein insertion efficiency factor YidD [Acidimicrobiales bacterium]
MTPDVSLDTRQGADLVIVRTARGRGVGRRASLAAIRAYQGLRTGSPSPCRFYPTCSAYTAEAIERHGAWKGIGLGLRRIVRCRPFGGRGIDLVPETIGREKDRR